MCGIFAWSGLKPGQFNKDKFNVLGIMNETRGEHSCGITVNGRIQVGTGNLKVYRDFAAVEEFPMPKEVPAVIGHTRHSTVGSHTAENAHPFGFGWTKQGHAFVGVHNGTLLNHEELAKKYGISLTEGEGKKERKKIDSEILLEILYTTGKFDVLSEYNGAAALKWQFLEEPNVMYYYHGKSKIYPVSTTPTEERPLYYYTEDGNSLYTSSIEDSLFVIGGTLDTVHEFDHNTVYKVTDGNIEGAEKFPIDRTGRFQKRGTSYNYGGYGTAGYTATTKTPSTNSRVKDNSNNTPAIYPDKGENIYKETPVYSLEELEGRVYFNKFRYWRNNSRITGHYTWVKGYGFYFLHRKDRQATEIFYQYVNKYFYDGAFYSKEHLPKEAVDEAFIPFKHGGESKEIVNPPIFHFYDGIMMEFGIDVEACKERAAVGREFSLLELSEMALHPIIDMSFVSRPAAQQRIYKNKKLFTGTTTPLESDRAYVVNVGNLVAMREITYPRINPTADIDFIKSIEEADTVEEEEEVIKDTIESIDEDLLDDEITKMFSFSYSNFPRYKRQLIERYGDSNRKVKQVISIIDTFTEATYKLLTVEPKEN